MSADQKLPYHGPLPDHLRTHLERANGIIDAGGTVFWKFTCAGCGSRQTFDEPNDLFLTGTCERCGHVTELMSAQANVGFAAVLPLVLGKA